MIRRHIGIRRDIGIRRPIGIRRQLVSLLLGAVVIVAAACAPTAPANQSPLAIFHPSVSNGTAPLTVSFNAGPSTDPDGTIVSFNWDFGDFTTGSGVATSHSFGPGTYVVRLTVTDDRGGTGVSATVISVTGTPSAPTGLQKVGSGCCDTYGDFKFDKLDEGSGKYQVEISAEGRGKKTVEANLGTSLNLGEIRL